MCPTREVLFFAHFRVGRSNASGVRDIRYGSLPRDLDEAGKQAQRCMLVNPGRAMLCL